MQQEWGQRALDELKNAEHWLTDHPLALPVLGVLLSLGAILRLVIGFSKNAPHMQLGFVSIGELVGDNVDIALRLTNDGGSTASNVRLVWHRRSSCDMTRIAQPFTLAIGQEQLIEFTARPIDLITRMQGSYEDRLLGWLEVTYRGRWRRRHGGRAVMIPQRDADLAQSYLDLTSPPRKKLGEAIPRLGKFIDERMTQHRARQFAAFVASCKTFLGEQGIPVEVENDDEDVFRRLLGELEHRGWRWNYSSAGSGYEIQAKKTWPPSTFRTIYAEANARVDTAAIALARAIQTDDEHSGRPPVVLAPYEPAPLWLRWLAKL